MTGIGKKLKEFREIKNLSQKEVATRLGITQVHVSRIESGNSRPSSALTTRIFQLIEDIEKYFDFSLDSVFSDGHWNFAVFVLGGYNSSGDRIRLNKKIFKTKTILFHCDSPGNDAPAKHMSDKLVVALESVLSVIQDELQCTPEFIYKSLDQSVKNTKEFFKRGAPSCNIMVFNRENKNIQVLNAGMPNIWITHRGQKSIFNAEGKKWHPLGASPSKVHPFSTEVTLKKGDTLFSFSDGFLDKFHHHGHSISSLKSHIFSIVHSLRGDAESIATNLLRFFRETLGISKIRDNISFVIVSRK